VTRRLTGKATGSNRIIIVTPGVSTGAASASATATATPLHHPPSTSTITFDLSVHLPRTLRIRHGIVYHPLAHHPAPLPDMLHRAPLLRPTIPHALLLHPDL
jgi:hypothetical protein